MSLIKLVVCGAALVAASSASGCATYYEDLMSNQQLIAANCSDLATERAKIESNMNASNEGAMFGAFSAVATAFVEADAGTDGTTTSAFAENSAAAADLATSWSEKTALIDRLRTKKGC